MKNIRILALALPFGFLAACASIESAWQKATSSGVEKTFNSPISRVKPAFVTTLTQMGMPIAALEVRGKNEVVKARKGDKSAEIEFERLSATSTRVRVNGSDEATTSQIMRETEKRLANG